VAKVWYDVVKWLGFTIILLVWCDVVKWLGFTIILLV
jgi:hypothetical protein